MSDEHDSWLKGALGVDVGKTLKKIESAGSSAIAKVTALAAPPAAPAPQPAATNASENAPAPAPSTMDRLKTAASNAGKTARNAGAKTIDVANKAGKALVKGETAAWEGTKTAYTAVTGAYDKVAPDFNASNEALGKGVDVIEAKTTQRNKKAAAEAAKVPIVGGILQGSALVSTAGTQAVGGMVKGVGDIAAMGGNAFVHPVDSAKSLAQGALGVAEHVPIAPGLNTTVKGVHGMVDLARGKKDGEYGSSVKDLGKNLLLDTKQDPDHPNKRTNADVDFAASLGGGTKAWTEKPVEAATRTLTNLAPMLAGDEAVGGEKPPPKGGSPVPKALSAPAVGYADVDPFTAEIARNNPDLVPQPTNRIPARTEGAVFRGEPLTPKKGPSELDQIRTKVADQRGGDAEVSKKNARSKR